MPRRSMLWTGAAALLLPLLLASPAAAQEARKGLFRNILAVFAPPTQEEEQRIVAQVGLSDEQKTQMRAVNERYRSDSSALMAKYNTAYEDVVRLMQATNPNKAEVNQRLKTFNQIHQEVVAHEVGYWSDFKAILTPEQNQKFWNMFEQNRIRGDQGGSKGGHGKSKGGGA